jgi:hypothetical protein
MRPASRLLAASLWISLAALPELAPAQPPAATGSSASPWVPALTPDGQPDIQGYWTNDTYTPLERPAELGDKELFTEEEAEAFLRSRVEDLEGQSDDDIHYDDALWQGENYGKVAHRRTSLIVEPRNGRLPPLTERGQASLAAQRAAQRTNPAARGAASRSLAERCITWGNVGPPMMPPTYNANLQILQAPGIVVIRHEMMHDTRFVYLDGRPHPGSDVQWLAGHSVGRWEGGSLVVDTTNFTARTNFRGSPQNTRQDIFASARLHVTERFTPVDANTLRYEFTVDDPDTWTSSWSGEMEIRRVEGPILEYACHEGNYGLANILRGIAVSEGRAP